jgi:flagellar hook assembly protein FlgD
VDVGVYDVRGHRVTTLCRGAQAAGSYGLEWDGRDDGGRRVTSGVYFVRLESRYGSATRRLVVLR